MAKNTPTLMAYATVPICKNHGIMGKNRTDVTELTALKMRIDYMHIIVIVMRLTKIE